jgi:hypothetical protein
MLKKVAILLMFGGAMAAVGPSASGLTVSGTTGEQIQVHSGTVNKEFVTYQRRGYRQKCGGDVCTAIAINPIRFVFDNQIQGYDALVTVSTNYRTSRNDRFSLSLSVKQRYASGHLAVAPDSRPLEAGRFHTGTYEFLVPNLHSDDFYDLWVKSKAEGVEGPNKYFVSLRHLIVTVQAVPRS